MTLYGEFDLACMDDKQLLNEFKLAEINKDIACLAGLDSLADEYEVQIGLMEVELLNRPDVDMKAIYG